MAFRGCFNEAAGAYPADAHLLVFLADPQKRFNEAAGAYPADAPRTGGLDCPYRACFNEAAGAYPADAALTDAQSEKLSLLQ